MTTKPPPEIVDERFWLAHAAVIIAESPDNLDQGAQRVAAAMAWFWTAYSGALVAIFAFGSSPLTEGWVLLIVSPVITLFIAYALSTWASVPVPVRFEVNQPRKIKAAYEAALETKKSRLVLSLIFAGVTTLLVSGVAIALALAGPPQSQRIAISFAASPTEPEVVVGGSIPVETDVVIEISPDGHPPINSIVPVSRKTPFTRSIPVPSAETYNVRVSWKDGERETSVREVIKRP